MKLFQLENLELDPRYCRVDVLLSCLGKLMEGQPAKPVMEQNGEEVLDLALNEDEGGLELPDHVGNTDNILPLRRGCAEAIVDKFDLGEHELLPARLINDKERVHSDDYVVLNPLGEHECLDPDRSELDPDGDVEIMGRWCLSAAKVPKLDIFRAKGVESYIFSERLVEFIESEGFSNFRFNPVTVS